MKGDEWFIFFPWTFDTCFYRGEKKGINFFTMKRKIGKKEKHYCRYAITPTLFFQNINLDPSM